MQTIRYMANEQEARDYRHNHGTGGWIFVVDGPVIPLYRAILFPPDMTPHNIFHHPATKGFTGRLIGSM